MARIEQDVEQMWRMMAEATREVTRHNEVERIKLRAKLNALEG